MSKSCCLSCGNSQTPAQDPRHGLMTVAILPPSLEAPPRGHALTTRSAVMEKVDLIGNVRNCMRPYRDGPCPGPSSDHFAALKDQPRARSVWLTLALNWDPAFLLAYSVLCAVCHGSRAPVRGPQNFFCSLALMNKSSWSPFPSFDEHVLRIQRRLFEGDGASSGINENYIYIHSKFIYM
jgi:hypothetical protein